VTEQAPPAPILSDPTRPDPTLPDPIAASALRKATWRLIPLIGLGYGTAYMDRINISFAALQMNQDLHFSATVYGFGAGLFFLSYSACEIPSNLLLYRFGARRWLARIMVTWGLVAMAMIFVRTPLEFYAVRFLLGVAEAGFFPGVLFYLMQWFPAHLRARTITRFYIAWPLSSVVMGSVAGGLLQLQGHLHLAGWQWLFLVEALPAILLGVLFLFLLPDSPADAKWLSEPERQSILAGVECNSAPAHPDASSILPVLRDPRVWLIGAFFFCMLGSGYAYTFSAPAIIQKATGLSTTRVGFVIAALAFLSACTMLWGGARSDRSGERHWNVIPHCLLVAAGFLACGLSNSPGVMIAGIVLVVLPYTAMQGPLLAIPATFLNGKHLAAGIAAMNMIGILGGFVGPYWMGIATDHTGDYQRGLLTMAPVMLLAAAIMFYLSRRAHAAAAVPASLPIASALDSANL
jgi:MFS transporter, ACS family, tartrate transporter